MRYTTGRLMTYKHTNRVGIDLASTGLAALAPIIDVLKCRFQADEKSQANVLGSHPSLHWFSPTVFLLVGIVLSLFMNI